MMAFVTVWHCSPSEEPSKACRSQRACGTRRAFRSPSWECRSPTSGDLRRARIAAHGCAADYRPMSAAAALSWYHLRDPGAAGGEAALDCWGEPVVWHRTRTSIPTNLRLRRCSFPACS
ncbi:hypothetical protein M758_11G159800 [Ceratodon purpureus]|uniref:Uncharacterized protein n=1 Tax=Ceratodon purpureus TaxID=3225 RepID=A0A8T0GLG9_CERPU|nr:hypothetical protein KC19_11G163900 [Ceratodon purpureus]KAG0602094.1 hypothetical protein M758_11G159800 [Ceratodon purpureus]